MYRTDRDAPIDAWVLNPTPCTIVGMFGGIACTVEPNHRKCHFDKCYINMKTGEYSDKLIPINRFDADHMTSEQRSSGQEGLVLLDFKAEHPQIRGTYIEGLTRFKKMADMAIMSLHTQVGQAISANQSSAKVEMALILDKKFLERTELRTDGKNWYMKSWFEYYTVRSEYAQKWIDNIDDLIKKTVTVGIPHEDEQIRGYQAQITDQQTKLATVNEENALLKARIAEMASA